MHMVERRSKRWNSEKEGSMVTILKISIVVVVKTLLKPREKKNVKGKV